MRTEKKNSYFNKLNMTYMCVEYLKKTKGKHFYKYLAFKCSIITKWKVLI